MITLALASAFFYLTLQNWSIFNGFNGFTSIPAPIFLGVNWKSPVALYYLILLFRRAQLRRRRLHLASAVRACPARHARQSTPHGGDRLQRHRSPHRRLCLRGAYRLGGWNSSGVAQQPDLAGHCRHRGDNRSSRHRGRGRPRASDRRLCRRFHLRDLADIRARRARRRRTRRAPLPDDHRIGLSRHRPVLARRHDRALAALVGACKLPRRRIGVEHDRRTDCGVAGTGNAIELRGRQPPVRRSRGLVRHHPQCPPRRAACRARVERRRQDDAAQLRDRRFSPDIRDRAILTGRT